MHTFDQLTQHVDPATLETEDQARKLKLRTPQELYELWERQHWSAHEIDLERDKEDWRNLPEETKDDIIWILSSFFIGEERVTTQFSGLVMAYADEQEESFLATQQVDEARHMQFFDRFYREVAGVDHDRMEDRLARVREELNDAFVELFDTHLVEAGAALIADPQDLTAKVEFVTIYHMVIEGALALTGQNFVTDYFEKEGILPGFVEGFRNIATDEHRHVAYGTWFLQSSAGQDDELARHMQDKLQRLLPTAAAVLVPKGKDPTQPWTLLDYTSDEVNEFAFSSLSRRLKAIGVPLAAGQPA
jgi:ribonucleoside-diphosphate reductase beta chain